VVVIPGIPTAHVGEDKDSLGPGGFDVKGIIGVINTRLDIDGVIRKDNISAGVAHEVAVKIA